MTLVQKPLARLAQTAAAAKSVMATAIMLACAIASGGDGTPRRPKQSPGAPPPLAPAPQIAKGIGLTLPFQDNIENGINGWQFNGFWHQVTNPQNIFVDSRINPDLVHLPDVAGQLPAPFSGSTCWWYGEDATGTFIGPNFPYPQALESGGTSFAANSGALFTPELNLTNVSQAHLTFKTWWEIEGFEADLYDLMQVGISTDGGQNFSLLGSGVLNPSSHLEVDPWRPYTTGGLGQPGVWVTSTFDLTGYVGNSIMLTFQFYTRDTFYNGFRGWLIDDVVVNPTAPPPPTLNSISPVSARVADIITLYGSNFTNGATVSIGSVGTTSAVISSGMAEAFVPSLAPGFYEVRITNPAPTGGTSALAGALLVTTSNPPDVTAVSPGEGDQDSTTFIEVQGANFSPGATVSVAGVPLQNVFFQSSTSLLASVPPGLPLGYQNVTVTNPDNQVSTLIGGFRVVILAPKIVGQTPSQIANVGQNIAFIVVATGKPPLAYQWHRGAAALSGETSDTLLISGASTGDIGTYFCRVSNAGGSADSATVSLNVLDPPQADAASHQGTTLPATLYPNQTLNVGFFIRNTSPVTWSQTQGYSLQIVDDPSNIVQSLGIKGKAAGKLLPISDPKEVVPNGNGTYQYIGTVKAPATTGDYSIDIQMVENNANPFGPAATVPIKVVPQPNTAADWEVFE